jgi:hypothetical protein
MAIFDRAFAFANGAVLGMASGGSLEGQGDPLPVDTMVEELAGVTPVPKHFILSTDSFVPQTGLEFDAVKKWLDTEEVSWKVQFGGSGKAVTMKGYLQAPSLKWGAADHTMLSFKAICKAAPFK